MTLAGCGRRSRPGAAACLGVACLAAGLLTGCGEPPPGPWVQEDGYRWRDVTPRGDGGFTALSAPRRGIDFLYDVDEDRRYENRVLVEGAGVAIGDVDGDGLADLFFAGFGAPSRLYRNRGGWRFDDITEDSGAGLSDVLARGAALVDIDGDADLDLVVAVHGGPNRILRNDGAGRFTASQDGFSVSRGSSSPALADIDADGDLDLYITNYKTRQADDVLTDAERAGLERARPVPDGTIVLPAPLSEHYRADFDGRFVRWWELGEVDELYLNDGSGTFSATVLAERLRGRAGEEEADSLRDWGLAARFSDWDGDGDPDLYVANDFNSADGIWLNRGDGTFDAAPATHIRSTSLSSMAVDMSDVDRDGDLDIVTTDMRASDPVERLTQRPNFRVPSEPPGTVDTRLQVNRNTLQLNRGDRTFSEAAHAAGISASDWTWGALFLDADLDGFEDLLVTTGHAWDQLDGDTQERLMRAPPGSIDSRRHLSIFPALRQPNVAFRSRGDGTFDEASERFSWSVGPDISHGIAAGDLDADGDLDVVVTRLGDPPLLMRNDSPAPRVLVRLEGSGGNTAGIGAWLSATGHPVGEQIDEIAAGGSYLSSSEPVAMFAVPEGGALQITVDWPDGARSVLAEARPNREYVLAYPGPPGVPSRTASETIVPMFSDRTDLLAHRHAETEFDDRARQPLLPVSLSRLGPGLSWIDIDDDADADLLIGSGRGGTPVVLINREGVFDPARALSAALGFDATALLGHVAADGRLDILVGVSNYEAPNPAALTAQPSVVALRIGQTAGDPAARAALEGAPSTTGPLAQADIDGDGDLDVFVGGRVLPGALPRPADSRVLLNQDGVLTFSAAASAPFAGVGLVSGAVFTDIDSDGDPDLALAVSWGSVRLFRNDGGSFVDASETFGLAGLVGRWNAITAADFDGDGSQDLVVTGWGDNTELPARYSLFHGDYDRNGQYDVIEAVRGTAGWRSLRGRDEIQAGLGALAQIPFATFAETPLEQVLGAALDTASRVDVAELRHLLLLNRGGSFEVRPLPREAQGAPSFGVVAADLDGDGHEDLFLSQNFYAGRPGVPRYDAGRGILLLGDGHGGFAPQSGLESGIVVYGDGRAVAAADFDLDGRVDLAIGVNGGETRLFRNELARPGLRVRLRGAEGNPTGVGATISVVYGDGAVGPPREVRSGEGYWSRNESAQTFGLEGVPAAVSVRWPDGSVTRVDVPEDASTVVVTHGSDE